jgi:hypothetical protein
MNGTSIGIPVPTLRQINPVTWRLSADIEGSEVFIESSVPLSARPEVFLSAFYLQAMWRRARVEVAGALDPTTLENLAFIRRRAAEWWPQLGGGELIAQRRETAPRGPYAGTFYTGGVDSSYVLQQLHPELKYAVFVEGFDIPLSDAARLAKAKDWLSATAKACGLDFLVARTNLREHPFFNAVTWEITHVAALAAVAHALADQCHKLYVAASDVPPPWGSAPDLDAAWSSGSVAIHNFSAELSRLDRARSIAQWEPLRGRLRVCWENNTGDLNCGFCEKCIRTRMQLYVSGARDGLDSFPSGSPIESCLARLVLEHSLHGQWREIAAAVDDPRLRKAIGRALGRSTSPKMDVWRRGTRKVGRIVGRIMARRRPEASAQ